MATDSKKQEPTVKDYAGGWITEKEGTDAPGFLKLAIPIIGLVGAAYLVLYINGDTGNADRGPLVRRFVDATSTADGLMYAVAALTFVFAVIVSVFAFRKSSH